MPAKSGKLCQDDNKFSTYFRILFGLQYSHHVTLEFTSSPDESIIGDYVTYKKILVQSISVADIVIPDNNILKIDGSIAARRHYG